MGAAPCARPLPRPHPRPRPPSPLGPPQVLDTYKPLVWEYSRLNITHNVMSKRKLNKLVTGGWVGGWVGGSPHSCWPGLASRLLQGERGGA